MTDGPTSSRLTVDDYDFDTEFRRPKAQWDENRGCFLDQEKQPILKPPGLHIDQFHQINVWAIVQRVLEFYEDFNVLGRPVPWAFNGNRLTIRPHASYNDNTITGYDREWQALNFAIVKDPNDSRQLIYTCLSHDIVAHETGHAVLDGIRPYFHKGYTLESEAFKEFIADLTAILSALRNNDIRHIFIAFLEKDKPEANFLADIAEEFGQAVTGREYLRTAHSPSPFTMDDVDKLEKERPDNAAHDASQVLTRFIFDTFLQLLQSYWKERKGKSGKENSPKQAANYAMGHITRLALQPLDYLPPVDVTFSDYVEALLLREELLYPDDPYQYRPMIRDCCIARKIQPPQEDQRPERPYNLANPYVDGLLASRTSAYEYIHANCAVLGIPAGRDVIVDVYSAQKVGRGYYRLPREIIVQYLWEEPVVLDDSTLDFGSLHGKEVPLLCGGTLVFDENSNFMYWVTKPGTEFLQEQKESGRHLKEESWKKLEEEQKRGMDRRQQLLKHTARLAAKNRADEDANVNKLLNKFLTELPGLNPCTYDSD